MMAQFHYEYPLGKFTRSCLKIDRLQALLASSLSSTTSFTETDHRNLLMRVLELHSLVSRPEFKNELISEIEKRLLRLSKLKNAPNIDTPTLDKTLHHLNASLQELKSISTDSYTQPLPYLIDSYKQRASVPGGQFEFDLPAFQHWLNKNKEQCHEEILRTVFGFSPIIDTMQSLLQLLRQSATASAVTANNGIFQLTAENNNYDLIIISVPQDLNIYPEISGGRYRVFIRFLEFLNAREKPRQTSGNIQFSLTCCRM